MPKQCVLLVIVAVAFTFIPAHVANSSIRAKPNSLPLELVLKSDRSTYRMSETLHLETQISNVGEKDIYIWEGDLCWNPARGLSMRIVGADGKDVQSPVLLDCVPPPPRQGNAYQFVKLSPERFYGHAGDFKLSELVNGPGEYNLNATFSSFLSSKWTAEFLDKEPIAHLSLWTMEQPTITSNRIHITVKP